MLTLQNVTHVYANGTRALEASTLSIPKGMFGLLGPNGAGKSTLMRCIATLQAPSSGSIRFDDIDVIAAPEQLRAVLGYLPQDFGVYPRVSAYELLDHLAVLKGIAARAERKQTVEALLQQVNLWDARKRPVAEYSGGMRQRFGIAQALIGNPRLLIVDEPMHFFSLQSARYAEQRETWRAPNGEEVALAVYYHPEHPYNVQRMLDATKLSLEIFTRSFSPYQFRQARILEFPGYESFAQSFANTVPYSEVVGFIQNHPRAAAAGDERIDLVTYVTAHEIAHQWWAHQIIGADKQGSTMLSETFAQYSAMLVMEQKYGPPMVRKFLKYELDTYLRSRGSEVVEELPLVRVENQDYIHYSKGTLVMYWLKESVGQAVVDRALQRLLRTYAFKPAPYPSSSDFIALLREEAGLKWDALITDLFEKITLYDLRARDASVKKRPDGTYEVTLTVEAKKLYADSTGLETEAALAEDFEVGAFSAQPGKEGFSAQSVLQVERRPLTSGTQQITFTLPAEPKWVGVDPYNKRIDRNSDDNLVSVNGS